MAQVLGPCTPWETRISTWLLALDWRSAPAVAAIWGVNQRQRKTFLSVPLSHCPLCLSKKKKKKCLPRASLCPPWKFSGLSGRKWSSSVTRVLSPVRVQIAFFLEKENNPPKREPAREELFKSCSVPGTPATTPVLCSLNTSSNAKEGQLDARDLEMSQKVRRSYSRLDTLGSLSTSTPGRRSCFGFEGAEDLSRVSPVVGSKPAEASRVPAKPWAPDTALPGISPLVVREKRKKKKVPQILKSELDEWAAAMNAEFEAAEQFDLVVE
uniref:Cell division cycle associated 5 n=1 Tax=Oryctolagus cuniculus TaxID=9986 RepID=A0A5F9DT40_RABIT